MSGGCVIVESVSEAWFGLIGVVVGGFITGGVDFVLSKRNERRLRRAAGRLLGLELDEARLFLAASVEQGRWGAAPSRVLSNEQWSEHRNVWAAGSDDWQAVANAFLRIAQVRQHHPEAESGTPLDRSLLANGLIDRAIGAIATARPLLDPSGEDRVEPKA